MIHEDIFSRHFQFKISDCRTTRWYQCCLDILEQRSSDGGFGGYSIKKLPDDVKEGDEIDAAVADKNSHGFADVRLHVANQSLSLAVEDNILRMSVEHFLGVKNLQALFAQAPSAVKLSLHNVKFPINFRQTFFWFN